MSTAYEIQYSHDDSNYIYTEHIGTYSNGYFDWNCTVGVMRLYNELSSFRIFDEYGNEYTKEEFKLRVGLP